MILVTGGAGFIGSNVVRQLLADGEQVIVLDNFNDYYSVRFKEQNIAPFLEHSNCVVVRGDITDRAMLDDIFASHPIEKVLHLAARAGVRPSIEDPLLYEEVNVRGTLHILETMRQHNCQDFYFASSSSVYGNQEKVPFSEDDPVDTPISPYAATKKACELVAYTYHHLHGMNCVGFRFFTVYGEGGRPDMAPYLFTEKILQEVPIKKFGDGSTRRDYTYVGDIVAGVISALTKSFGYSIFNLGNHQTVSLNELIKVTEAACGKKALIDNFPPQPGDVTITYADIRKAKELLDYEPRISISEGMSRFVGWYKDNRFNQKSHE